MMRHPPNSTLSPYPPLSRSVELIRSPPPLVPAGPLRFRSTGALPKPGEITTVPLTWITAERRSATLWVSAQVSIRSTYAMASRDLAAREAIRPPDFTMKEGALLGPPDRFGLAPADLAGKIL